MPDFDNIEQLELIFNQYYDKVYSFIYVRLRDKHVSEDLTSQTFLKIAEKIHTYDSNKGALTTWIFTIALNMLRSHLRKMRRHNTISIDDLGNLEDIYATDDTDIEERRALYTAISHLGSREKNIIYLKYYAEMTNREIAAILGMTESNAGVILCRAIKKLKNVCNESVNTAYKGIGG